jgi:hypothetical protein
MTRYLARGILTKCNIHNSDECTTYFAEPTMRMDGATDGVTTKPKTSPSNYVNVQELQSIWSQFRVAQLARVWSWKWLRRLPGH